MQYKARKLVNRTGKRVEFFYDRQPYIFEKGEVKLVRGEVAEHALKFTNTGLEVLTPEIEMEMKAGRKGKMPDYESYDWHRLVRRMGKKFKPGMKKAEIVDILKKRWIKKHAK